MHISIVILLVVIFSFLAFFIAYFFGSSVFKKKYGELSELELRIVDAKRRLESSKKEVEREIESFKKEETLKVKEELLKERKIADEEIKQMKSDILLKEDRIAKKEESLEAKIERVEDKEVKLERQREKLNRKETELKDIIEKEEKELERISELTREDASKIILTRLENELDHDKAVLIRDYEHNLDREKDRIAKRIISTAIGKASSDYVVDSTISVIQLPSEEMKGRIIGREGRNIRAIEAATGVDLIIDDTPEVIVISSFDPLRREIAKITIETLIKDGRIHPTRIEEIYDKTVKEMKQKIIEYGNDALFKLGITRVPTELIEIIGKLHFRTSYGQNALQHSMEVASLAGVMAAELGENVSLAKRAGLLHDIGKAIDHEIEGSHVDIGVEIAKKYKENDVVMVGEKTKDQRLQVMP